MAVQYTTPRSHRAPRHGGMARAGPGRLEEVSVGALTGRVAVVAGATRGAGRGIACARRSGRDRVLHRTERLRRAADPRPLPGPARDHRGNGGDGVGQGRNRHRSAH